MVQLYRLCPQAEEFQRAWVMNNSTLDRRLPLGLFPGQPAPRLYDRLADVLRTRHHSRRTEQAYCFRNDPTRSEGGKQKAEGRVRRDKPALSSE